MGILWAVVLGMIHGEYMYKRYLLTKAKAGGFQHLNVLGKWLSIRYEGEGK